MRWTLVLVLVALGVSAQERPTSEQLYQAIRNDDIAALRVLVRSGGANVSDSFGQTPLMIAGAFGSLDAMQMLIAVGADVKAVSKSGLTALHLSTGDVKKVRLLVDQGADVNVKSTIGRTPLLVAASTSGTREVVELLLDKGADVNVVDVTGIVPLIAAASVDDSAVVKLLLSKGAAVNARANVGQSATALMGAAYNGNAELTRLLLANNAQVDAVSEDRTGTVRNGPVQFGNVTALHMATSSGSAEVVKLLLDAGARVDAVDVRGMTPLMWSVSTDRPEPRVVSLLLAKGADASVRSKLGESTIDWSRKFNHPAVLAALNVKAVGPPKTGTLENPDYHPSSSREAVLRSLPLLRRASAGMRTQGGCVACHAQPVTVMAADLAGARGWGVERAEAEADLVISSLSTAVQTLLQAREGGGSPDTQLYDALMMAARKSRPIVATDALVYYLAAKQRATGNWRGVGATRAPIQDGDFSRTAMGIRALAVYGIPARRKEFTSRIERAVAWLSEQNPLTTEDRVMQLLGLTWANINSGLRANRMRELIALQRPDGGWAQTPYLVSDAYATGQVVYTLRELGIAADDPTVERGAAFLLRTQQADGSWYVRSRAMKIQPYFESGFPYHHDQWISQAGTAWAVMALSSIKSDSAPEAATAGVGF
jgi:ankyrin repeat protein